MELIIPRQPTHWTRFLTGWRVNDQQTECSEGATFDAIAASPDLADLHIWESAAVQKEEFCKNQAIVSRNAGVHYLELKHRHATFAWSKISMVCRDVEKRISKNFSISSRTVVPVQVLRSLLTFCFGWEGALAGRSTIHHNYAITICDGRCWGWYLSIPIRIPSLLVHSPWIMLYLYSLVLLGFNPRDDLAMYSKANHCRTYVLLIDQCSN